MKPRHLPTKNTRTRELREKKQVESSFAKSLIEWAKIREEQRFRFETFETQWD